MVNALESQIRLLVFTREINPWERWHPLRPLVHWYSTHQINKYLNVEIDRHVAKFKDRSSAPAKSIVSLALQAYS